MAGCLLVVLKPNLSNTAWMTRAACSAVLQGALPSHEAELWANPRDRWELGWLWDGESAGNNEERDEESNWGLGERRSYWDRISSGCNFKEINK